MISFFTAATLLVSQPVSPPIGQPETAPAAVAPAPQPPAPQPPAAVLLSFDSTGAQQTRVARGVLNRGSTRAVDADSLVRVASVSKLAVALGVMRLVDQRRIDLDADVSTYLGWRLRHPAHPDRPITLAMLLSHRSGLTDSINYVLPLDADLETELRQPAAWEAARRPGGGFRYANINYPVVAAALEGATGERFDRLMQRLVFQPLRIDACFNWTTCSDGAVSRAVTLYRPTGEVARDDLDGQRPACPVVAARDGSCDLATYRLARNGASFSPQGGMRISMRGLARLGEVLLRDGDRFISRRSFQRMTRLQPVAEAESDGGLYCSYGLAVHNIGPARGDAQRWCRSDPFGDATPQFGHAGEAYSLRSGLFLDPVSGTGTAWFVTQQPEFDAPLGVRSIYTAAEEAMFAEAGLTGPRPVQPRRR